MLRWAQEWWNLYHMCKKVKTYLFLMFFSVVRQEVRIGKVIIHDQFQPETFDNDIALVCKLFCLPPPKKKKKFFLKKFETSQIKLEQPVSLEVHTPACLPSTKFFKVILMMMMVMMKKIRIMIIMISIIMRKILMTLLACTHSY